MISALEFYSGIGGLHLALKRSNIQANVVVAFDWDPAACDVYNTNFGRGIARRVDISQLTADYIATFKTQLWLLSPACQPYTVLNPNAKGARDSRAHSFLRLIQTVLPELSRSGNHPRWILVENVAGFENSTTRQILVDILQATGYTISEFLLTPLQFGIPNSRLRYYCLAKRSPQRFYNASSQESLSMYRCIPGHGDKWVDPRAHSELALAENQIPIKPLSAYLDLYPDFDKYAIPDKVLRNKAVLFDIVKPSSTRSCCFTRGYTHMIEGTSILQMNEDMDTTETFNAFGAAMQEIAMNATIDAYPLHVLRPLRLRYFTPDELLRIFDFNPPEISSDPECSSSNSAFHWPESVSLKTRYRLIGNSVNVKVVTELIKYLFEDDVLTSTGN